MRHIEVSRDREWIVVQTTRYRRGKPPLVKRTYWTPDEFAQVVRMVRELIGSPSTSAGESGLGPVPVKMVLSEVIEP